MKLSNCITLIFIFVLTVGCTSDKEKQDESNIKEDITKPSKELLNPISLKIKFTFPSSLIGTKVNFLSTDSKPVLNSFVVNGVIHEENIQVDSARLVQLNLGDSTMIPLLLTRADSILEVKIENNNFELDYEVFGYEESLIFKEYLDQFAPNKKHNVHEKLDFLRRNSPSFAIACIYDFEFHSDVTAYVDRFSVIKSMYDEAPYATNLLSKIETLTRGEFGYGKVIPDFKLGSLKTGDVIGPSNFRGKYLLIDFWASWCGPCRAENPNVKKIYGSYSRDDFDILAVSIDRSEQKWQGVVKEDGLKWHHVRDVNNTVQKEYGVSAVPTIYLLNRRGEIVGKNLRGRALGNALRYLLGE